MQRIPSRPPDLNPYRGGNDNRKPKYRSNDPNASAPPAEALKLDPETQQAIAAQQAAKDAAGGPAEAIRSDVNQNPKIEAAQQAIEAAKQAIETALKPKL